jgi:uncharacterized protein (TIGR03083 family)
VDSATDPGPWVSALRASHDRLTGIVNPLDSGQLRARSYDSEWSIADVLSHLGSGAEIFLLNLNAGLAAGDPPPQADYQAIWDVWNELPPDEQAARGVAVNGSLVGRLESLSDAEVAAFRLPMFGMTMDLAGLLRMRLSEHAVHTWDVAVALDPSARVAPDAVSLLIDGMGNMMPWMGKKAANPQVIAVTTTDPERAFTLDTGGVTLTAGSDPDRSPSGSLDLTAETLLRLVYGRVDELAAASGEVRASNVDLAGLRAVFPGF